MVVVGSGVDVKDATFVVVVVGLFVITVLMVVVVAPGVLRGL